MQVSSSTQQAPTTKAEVQASVIKKAIDTQEQNVTKVLESSNEQAQQVSAQKTGIGKGLDITG